MKRKIMVAIGAAAIAAILLFRWACRSEWPEHDGKIRQTANLTVEGLRRGAPGHVTLEAVGNYTRRDADSALTFRVSEIESAALELVDASGKATPLKVKKWSTVRSRRRAELSLPEVPDGDYKLRASYATALGKGTIEADLPLYSPARVHVITDRPLYEAGNLVRFRAVVLRARDLAPIDGRPGRWVVHDPSGEIFLEEKAPAGEFGVVAGSFPLDKGATTGSWRVQWISSDASDEVAFTVQPFTLPRFRVEAQAARPFYSTGDAPSIKGAVLYSSGAPVAGAKLEIEWQASGDWPPPLEWEEKLLPKLATAGGDGHFELALPALPADLQGKTTLTAIITATDGAGERLTTAVPLLFSQDKLAVSAVTELGDGLVAGFNNRLYLRVTTPDGRVVQGAKIKVRRAWQASDPGVEAALDEDGVAALQLDPGAPVNVVIPAAPWRPAPRRAEVTRGEPNELIGSEGASLDDQLEMDRWLVPLAACAKFFDPEEDQPQVGLRVSAAGAITQVSGGGTQLTQCVAGVLRGRRLPAAGERMYVVPFHFSDPDLPQLSVEVSGVAEEPPQLEEALQRMAAAARDCLPLEEEGDLPRALTWRLPAGARQLQLGPWIQDPQGGPAPRSLACVTARVAAMRAPQVESASSDEVFGLARFSVTPPERARQQKPQPTMMLGYELLVSADTEGAPSTKLRIAPGEIPALRMRVTPVLAKPGETVTAELIRGPSFSGELPKKLSMRCLKKTVEAKLDAERKAQLAVAPEATGWCEVQGGGVRALVYVRPPDDLKVTLAPEQPRYAPGQKARLAIKTFLGGQGSKAAVGLFGVDESLGQLAPLAGPGDMDRLRPQVETASPAFGVLDGQALTLGRIQGANAAAATVLRVSAIPQPPELDAVVHTSSTSRFDPLEDLTDHFYTVLGELYAQARAWEQAAPPAEKMKPETMVKLWQRALDACKKRGERIDDAYGRPLKLRRLPADLLALTAPQAVITGTRLPEDIENWEAWVARRRP
jgi:hypothetical protein